MIARKGPGLVCGLWFVAGTALAANGAEPNPVRPIPDGEIGAAKAYVAPKFKQPPTIDGKLDDWKGLPAAALKFPFLGMHLYTLHYGGEKDLSAVSRIGWDEKALYVAMQVVDDKHAQIEVGTDIWRHDSIQVAVDPRRDRSYYPFPYGWADDDIEVGWGLDDQQEIVSFRWQPDASEDPEDVEAKIVLDGTKITYEAAIPWSTLEGFEPKHGTVIGMNLVVNDSDDGDTRKGWLDWTPGTTRFKRPFDFATVLLVDDAAKTPAVAVDIDTPWVLAEDGISGRVVMGFPEAARGSTVPLKVSLGSTEVVLEAKCGANRLAEATFTVPATKVKAGEQTIVAQAGHSMTRTKLKVWEAKALASFLLDQIETDLPTLGFDLDMALGYQLHRDQAQEALRLVLRLQGDAWEDLGKGRFVRAAHESMALRRVLERGIVLIKDAIYTDLPMPEVPHYQTGRIKIQGRSFVANTFVPMTGEEEERPVFFTGFGHFNQVVKDLPEFHELGANLIQIEIGPNSVMPAEGKIDRNRFQQHILGALKEADRANVMVNVLVSPHYFPAWALEKWPQLKNYQGGFFKHTIDAPEAKKIQEDFLKEIVPDMAKAESLHSICLSNEPVYYDSRRDRVTQAMWKKFLAERHKEIAVANKAWGTQFASFDAVPIPDPAVPSDVKALPLFYDWCTFNMQRFAAWHAWEADVIKKLAPDVPVHAKIMPRIFRRKDISNGVDPELFAAIGAINGNDCWADYYHNPKNEWTHHWLTMNMFLDLQRSLREAPICNSENHFIADRDLKWIPPKHTSTVLWQEAIHGQCAEASWVWERTDDPKSDFAGSILHRPEHVFEHGLVGFDLMRLSKEVTAMQNAPRRVALLYSVASIIHQPKYVETIKAVYTALNFAGVHVGFLSERQIAAGRMGNAKLLIVPQATHVPKAVVERLAQWSGGGGRVVTVGEGCLAHDEYRHPISTKVKCTSVSDDIRGAPLRDVLIRQLHAAGIKPLAVVTDLKGKPAWGIEYRTAKYDGKVLVNMVNLTRRPVDLQINGGKDNWTDRRNERWMTTTFRLKPQTPLLVMTRSEEEAKDK